MHLRPEVGALLPLRKELGLYANLRPCMLSPSLLGASTLKAEVLQGGDIMVIRELTGGAYFGEKHHENLMGGVEKATDCMTYTSSEIERIIDLA